VKSCELRPDRPAPDRIGKQILPSFRLADNPAFSSAARMHRLRRARFTSLPNPLRLVAHSSYQQPVDDFIHNTAETINFIVRNYLPGIARGR
jgi:hypothetical protein